jgi:hypothetical protein
MANACRLASIWSKPQIGPKEADTILFSAGSWHNPILLESFGG